MKAVSHTNRIQQGPRESFLRYGLPEGDLGVKRLAELNRSHLKGTDGIDAKYSGHVIT